MWWLSACLQKSDQIPSLHAPLGDVLSHQTIKKALICAVFSAPNRLHSCLLSPYSARHSSDVAGAKAVGWLPLSDGKLLLMCCWVGCQVLALLVRGRGGGRRRGRGRGGEEERRRRRWWGWGLYRKGALSTLRDSGICCGNDLHPSSSPLFLTLPPSLSVPLPPSLLHSLPPSLSLCLCLFNAGDQTTHPEVSRRRSDATGGLWLPTSAADCWISHSLCTFFWLRSQSSTVPLLHTHIHTHNCACTHTHTHTHTRAHTIHHGRGQEICCCPLRSLANRLSLTSMLVRARRSNQEPTDTYGSLFGWQRSVPYSGIAQHFVK